MRNSVLAGLMLVALSSFGCGDGDNSKYDFKGTWMGSLSSAATKCSDGSSTPSEITQISFTILAGKDDDLYWNAQCGDFHFTQHGNIATQARAITCPPRTTPTSQITQSFRDGSLILNGNAMQVDLISDFSIAAGGKTGSCNGVHSMGVLVRQ